MWRSVYLDLENFCWNNNYKYKKAVNLYIINQISWSNLISTKSQFGSSYCLKLKLNSETAFVLQYILDNNFLKNMKIFKSLMLDNSTWFSSKIKDFRRNTSNLDSKNSFLFLFNKRETYLRSILKSYSTKSLSNNNLLVIETHISTYNISRRDKLSLFIEYTLLLYTIFFL